MKEFYRPVKVTEKVYWVGAVDWNIRDFHGYTVRRGTTYNAYLIMGEKVILVDTVKAAFKDEMLARIAHLVDPKEISCIISNHAELDHSGCLKEIIEETRPERVFASTMGARALSDLFGFTEEITPVKDGESLTLGDVTLSFLETRMLHWPDSMFTYLPQEGFLFSQDAFGMHLATLERFSDEIDEAILTEEARRYYANIILPYSPLVLKLIERVQKMGLDLKTIAPDHGPIWRKDQGKIIEQYVRWATQTPERRGVVLYGSMWGGTELMARALGDGLAAGGLKVSVMSVDAWHRSDIINEIHQAGVLAVGSSTLNGQILPAVADVLTYMKGLKPVIPLGAAFGAYGWSGEAAAQIEEVLRALKMELAGEA
ncbi:MAG: FprA family A-type flavoprotein, partial [Smithellaceae bacterium]|nr:FprA family A-type flavoprotein [Smithellaceae bacterium]